ncbi:hypothetical protein ACVIHH_002929 [Bradyrhizobium sp. USDA 4518]
MTTRARLVLDDCRLALQMLEDETELRRWRLHWVAAIALIRAVGHVLDKVDGKDTSVKKAARAAYAEWTGTAQEHEIFREFIERERNTILKEYEFNLHPDEAVEVVVSVPLKRVSDGKVLQGGAIFPLDGNVYRPLLDGFREGDDARDVLSEAIDWWDRELSEIERMASGEYASDGGRLA